jgi:hypothetical protein
MVNRQVFSEEHLRKLVSYYGGINEVEFTPLRPKVLIQVSDTRYVRPTDEQIIFSRAAAKYQDILIVEE